MTPVRWQIHVLPAFAGLVAMIVGQSLAPTIVSVMGGNAIVLAVVAIWYRLAADKGKPIMTKAGFLRGMILISLLCVGMVATNQEAGIAASVILLICYFSLGALVLT